MPKPKTNMELVKQGIGSAKSLPEPMQTVQLRMPVRFADELKYRARFYKITTTEYVIKNLKLNLRLDVDSITEDHTC